MKGDGVLNLLIFQAFQDVRMASSLVRSTIQTLGIPRAFAFFGVVGFGWKWLDESSYARRTQTVEIAALLFKGLLKLPIKGLKKQVMVFILLNGYTDKKHINRDMWRIYNGIQQRIPELHIRAAIRA